MMYGSAHLDTQLHEPWPVPDNVGPNHCPVGCSILLNAPPPPEHGSGIGGQIGRGLQAVKRRFSNSAHSGIPGVSTGAIGGPANFGPGYSGSVQGMPGKGRSNSLSGAGVGSPVREKSGWMGSSNPFSHSYVGSSHNNGGGGSGGSGGVGAIFDDFNPFSKDKSSSQSQSTDSKGPESSAVDADKSDDSLAASKGETDASTTNTLPTLGSLGSVGRRESAIRFGTCPSRPPELRRQSSITLGVAARRGLLMEGNDAPYGRNNTSPGLKQGADGTASGSIVPPRRNSASPTTPTTTQATTAASKADDIDAKFRAYQHAPPKEHSEADLRPVKSFWHKVLHPSDSHPTHPHAPPGSLSDTSTTRRASAPVLSTRQNMYKSSPVSPVSPTNPITPTSPASPASGRIPSVGSGARGSPTTPSSGIIPGTGHAGMLEVLPEHEGERGDRTPTGSIPGTPRGSTSRLAALPGTSSSPNGSAAGIGTGGSSERLNDQVKGLKLSEIYGRPGSPGSLGFEGVVPRGRASPTSSGHGSGSGSGRSSMIGPQSTSVAHVTPGAMSEHSQTDLKADSTPDRDRGGEHRVARKASYDEWAHPPSHHQQHPQHPRSPLSASGPTMPTTDYASQGENHDLSEPHIKLGNEPKPPGHAEQADGVNATLRHPDPSVRAPSPPPPASSDPTSGSADGDLEGKSKQPVGAFGKEESKHVSPAVNDSVASDEGAVQRDGMAAHTSGRVPQREAIRRRASDASPASPMETNRAGERSHAVLGFHARLANVGKGFTSGM